MAEVTRSYSALPDKVKLVENNTIAKYRNLGDGNDYY